MADRGVGRRPSRGVCAAGDGTHSAPYTGDVNGALSLRPIGLVTNVWAHQLDRGAPLGDLVSRASDEGVSYLELRQGSLGQYEDAQRLPDVDRLAALAAAHPSITFVPAYEVPFLDEAVTASHPAFRAGNELATAVAGRHGHHLRLVDLDTPAGAAEGAGTGLQRLAEAALLASGALSIENARQGWTSMWKVFNAVRGRLGARSDALRLCVDPCNLSWLAADDTDPTPLVAGLPPALVGMIHCKQHVTGALQPVVGPGAVDWRRLLSAIESRHPTTPLLFEMASSPQLWEYLAASIAYLRGLGSSNN